MTAASILRRVFDNVGWPGMLGMALLLGAGVMTVTDVQLKTAQVSELQQESLSLKRRIAQAAQSGIPVTGNEDDLAKFYGFFDNSSTTSWLEKLYAAAASQNLQLLQGEYSLKQDPDSKLMRYQISLPVHGSYPQIRRFVAQLLTDVPIASLDDISFKRESVADAVLEAHIKLTLFLSADSVGAP